MKCRLGLHHFSGLNLEQCAVSGASEDLAFISPKTGRAVSRRAAGEWADRLLLGIDHPNYLMSLCFLRTIVKPVLSKATGQYPYHYSIRSLVNEQPDELSQAFQILRHFFEKFPVKELNLQIVWSAKHNLTKTTALARRNFVDWRQA